MSSPARQNPVLHNAAGCPDYAGNRQLREWVDKIAQLTQPDRIHWCDGSQAEYAALCHQLVAAGTLRKLDSTKRPDSFLALSDPSDVAREIGRAHV